MGKEGINKGSGGNKGQPTFLESRAQGSSARGIMIETVDINLATSSDLNGSKVILVLTNENHRRYWAAWQLP